MKNLAGHVAVKIPPRLQLYSEFGVDCAVFLCKCIPYNSVNLGKKPFVINALETEELVAGTYFLSNCHFSPSLSFYIPPRPFQVM